MTEKGEILVIGTFDENGYPVGWFIRGGISAINITDEGALFGGYTIAELREIHEKDKS